MGIKVVDIEDMTKNKEMKVRRIRQKELLKEFKRQKELSK